MVHQQNCRNISGKSLQIPCKIRFLHTTCKSFVFLTTPFISFSAIGSKPSKMEVMELSDLHHPNCKINRNINSGDLSGIGDRRESESSDSVILSPEASKATEAVEFIAEHLKNEDSYIQVSFNWNFSILSL